MFQIREAELTEDSGDWEGDRWLNAVLKGVQFLVKTTSSKCTWTELTAFDGQGSTGGCKFLISQTSVSHKAMHVVVPIILFQKYLIVPVLPLWL